MDEDQRPLKEENFINEGYKKNPTPFWIWLFFIAVAITLVWGGRSWYINTMKDQIFVSPFLQVSNRDFSLFLWENPEYMRVNAKTKTGYLPAFQYLEKINVEPEMAEQNVVAPPELLFRYHIWQYLLSDEYSVRPISLNEFREFLLYCEEWLPKYWPVAPPGYVDFINSISSGNGVKENLENLPLSTLPLVVRKAFDGWKNYFKEGTEINDVKPTFAEMKHFLTIHPDFSRNYWRNIVPDYLKTLALSTFESDAIIPRNEIPPYLRAAFYNFKQSNIKVEPKDL